MLPDDACLLPGVASSKQLLARRSPSRACLGWQLRKGVLLRRIELVERRRPEAVGRFQRCRKAPPLGASLNSVEPSGASGRGLRLAYLSISVHMWSKGPHLIDAWPISGHCLVKSGEFGSIVADPGAMLGELAPHCRRSGRTWPEFHRLRWSDTSAECDGSDSKTPTASAPLFAESARQRRRGQCQVL